MHTCYKRIYYGLLYFTIDPFSLEDAANISEKLNINCQLKELKLLIMNSVRKKAVQIKSAWSNWRVFMIIIL